jgi:hypothetical protein
MWMQFLTKLEIQEQLLIIFSRLQVREASLEQGDYFQGIQQFHLLLNHLQLSITLSLYGGMGSPWMMMVL